MLQYCTIYYYESYNDYFNLQNRKSKCIPYSAFKHNKDVLKLYMYDKCVFDSGHPLVYITSVIFA